MAAEQDGTVTIRLADFAESNPMLALSFDERLTSQGTATPSGVQVSALPTIPYVPIRARRLILGFIIATTGTLATNAYRLPVDIVNDTTGQVVSQRIINYAQMTVNVATPVCTAGVEQRLGHYDAPVGCYLQLSAGSKYHAFITT